MAYKSFAAGYLVKNGKVLLVHHNKFDAWVPPGGHIEENEAPVDAVKRELSEELSIGVEIISAVPIALAGDNNAAPIPLPFYMDLEIEGFDVPHIGYFYYIRPVDPEKPMVHQKSELHAFGWFSKEDLVMLKTFDQVRSLAVYAIDHYPTQQ